MTGRARLLLGSLVALLLLGSLAWWIHESIEWVDIDVRNKPEAPVSRDRFAAAKALVKQLGGSTQSHPDLIALPPPGATLILATRHWTLFPDRVQALERWVRAGGRLVLLPDAWTSAAEKVQWLPVRAADIPRRKRPTSAAASAAKAASAADDDSDDDDDDDEDDNGDAMVNVAAAASAPPSSASSPSSAATRSGKIDSNCRLLHEPGVAVAAYGTPRVYRVCGYPTSRVRKANAEPSWVLELGDDSGSVMMRAPLGSGSVTFSAIDFSFIGSGLLEYDGALAFAAALSMHAGDLVWFVIDEKSPTLLSRIWHNGKSVVLLSALALALALWRGATRFGPLAATPSTARRSVGEQIRRTAAFIAGGGGGALHRAAIRALDEAARRSLPGYAALLSAGDRAQAIAAATGLDAAALAGAIALPGRVDATSALSARRRVGAAVGLLEQARRAVLAQASLDPSHPRRATP